MLQKAEFDVVVSAVPLIDALVKKGLLRPESHTNFAKVGVGVSVRKGAPRPDISTVDAFKAAMLKAKTIAHGDPAGGGAGSVYMPALFSRLGIAEQMKQKTRLLNAHAAAHAIAEGEVEMGLTQVSEILAYDTIALAGPLPLEIQNYTHFAAGVLTASRQSDAAMAFIKFLVSPAAATIMRSKGLE